MAKGTHVTVTLGGKTIGILEGKIGEAPRRALNDVEFAGVIDSLLKGTFGVKATARNPGELSPRTFDYNFDKCGVIVVNGNSIVEFLRDVEQIVAENVEHSQIRFNLHTANQQFADEHARLCARINEKDALIADQKRRLDSQSESIGHYQEREERFEQQRTSDAVAIEVIARQKGTLEEIIAELRAERTNLLNRIESQRKTIIDFQQKQPTFAHLSAEIERLLAERTALVVLRLVVNHDGSVTAQTDGPLSIDGNVECKGANAA